MFIDENAFDDEFDHTGPKYSTTENRPPNGNSINLGFEDDENDADTQFRGPGSSGNPASNSRARMLAQQRELQLKKRQSNMLSGGMVRSSLDSSNGGSPFRQSQDSQFTPAVRQFSAPKATVKDTSNDASPGKDSEFTKKNRNQQDIRTSADRSNNSRSRNKYSDEEEDEDENKRAGLRRDGRDGRDRAEQRREGYSNGRKGRGRDDVEDEYEYDRDRDRRTKGKDKDSRDQGERRGRYQDEEDDYDGHYQDRGGGGKWAGTTGGRDVQGREARESRGHGGQATAVGREDFLRSSSEAPISSERGDRGDRGDREGAGVVAVAMPVMSSFSSAPVQSKGAADVTSPNLSDMRRFLMSPVPKKCGVLQCYIRRNKGGTNKLFPIYSLFLKEGDVFLMASKKRPKNKTSNYLISMDQSDLNRAGRSYLGKLRSNFVGTEFQVFDNGLNPKGTDADEGASGNTSVRCELGSVMYAANMLGSRGPRKMQVALPGLDVSGEITRWRDSGMAEGEGGDDILSRMKDRNLRNLCYLINKPPRWNEQVGAYVLNFNGRVTMASVKNFQLVDPDEQNAVVLQFGRVGKDEFTMDLQWPISPFQAFALTLSSFDSKIACD
ncbi:Tub family-domain-containing protein [Ochromonadaceae sp. CCMP2298]|nr:Tub family-domain-containing protein [Ochromonadaceae sp. CCMP2298]